MVPHGMAHGGRRIVLRAGAVCSTGVTHDELRSLLAPYAAGTLPTADAEALRGHLATGCTTCLDALFRLPVGLPRAATDGARPVVPALVEPPAHPAAGAPWSVVVALGIGLALSLVWIVRDAGERVRLRHEASDLGLRLGAVQEERTALGERVDARNRELAEARAGARADATRFEDERRSADAARADLERDLAASQARVDLLTRGVQRRDRELERLSTGTDDGEVVRELLVTPGLQVLRLEPVSPFREGRGHALWSPSRDVVVVYAFGLPELPSGESYRIRVGADGAEAPPRTFRPGPGGKATMAVRLGGEAGVLREVSITRERSEEPVLAGRSR
jgi:hypothetical protein